MSKNNKDVLTETVNYFKSLEPNVDSLSDKRKSTQAGCVCEEFAEWLHSISKEFSLTDEAYKAIEGLSQYLQKHNTQPIKKQSTDQKIEELDAICDIIVTLAGRAYHKGYDLVGALDEINKSNYSKAEIENGKPVFKFTDYGKIIKGKNFFIPDLSKFI